MSYTNNAMSILKFMEVTSSVEHCDKTRPDLKEELITLRNKITVGLNPLFENLENWKDIPNEKVTELFEEVQQYKKYF